MQVMIADLIHVMKDEENRPVFEYTLSEIREILLEKTQPRAIRKQVVLAVEDSPGRDFSGRDGNLLLLVLVNLVDNAIDASEPGNAVSVRFLDSASQLVIDVRDQGPGIPKELQEQLFSPKKSAKERGAGIGLAIAHQLARNIGADIRLKETSSAGTCFSVALEHGDSCANPT